MRRRILLSPGGLPCTPPPFGTLVAIDLKAGGRLWEVPLGSPARLLPPEQAAKIPAEWGSPSLGGPIVTAGGGGVLGAPPGRRPPPPHNQTGRARGGGAPPPRG